MVEEERWELLVLGLGNMLCGDDGLGPAAVELLPRSYEVPPGVRVLDGGTLGLSLLPYVQQARRLLLIDAVFTGEPPGSPVRLEGDAVGLAVRNRLSVHQIGVADLMESARMLGCYPSSVLLLGMVPESIELKLGLSPVVEAGLPDLLARIAVEAHQMGFRFLPQKAVLRADGKTWQASSSDPFCESCTHGSGEAAEKISSGPAE